MAQDSSISRRGNGPRGAWSVAGGYDPIAEQLFNDILVDRLLLEYDTPRSGTFAPFALSRGTRPVLGAVTEDIQRAKLETLGRVAPEVWGGVNSG